jgi:hypothetical protein
VTGEGELGGEAIGKIEVFNKSRLLGVDDVS